MIRLASVSVNRAMEREVTRRGVLHSDETLQWLVCKSALLPLPAGWRFWQLAFNPDTGNTIAIIEHDSFELVADGGKVPKWPVYTARALAHLTLCEGTRLHA